MTYIHFRIPPPTRSPTSTKGLPSIGESQPSFTAFLLLPSLGDNLYKSHSSFLNGYKAKRGRRRTLLTFTSLLIHQTLRIFHTFDCTLLSFHAEKGGIFIDPNGFQKWSQEVSHPRFWGYWWYHYLYWVVLPLNLGGTIA